MHCESLLIPFISFRGAISCKIMVETVLVRTFSQFFCNVCHFVSLHGKLATIFNVDLCWQWHNIMGLEKQKFAPLLLFLKSVLNPYVPQWCGPLSTRSFSLSEYLSLWLFFEESWEVCIIDKKKWLVCHYNIIWFSLTCLLNNISPLRKSVHSLIFSFAYLRSPKIPTVR